MRRRLTERAIARIRRIMFAAGPSRRRREPKPPRPSLLQEWSQLQASGVLADAGGLVCAFSRDQERKVYVQHKIREQSASVWDMLHARNATIFVSGSASKMPAAVADAVAAVISGALPCDMKAAIALQRRLEGVGRYKVEAWS